MRFALLLVSVAGLSLPCFLSAAGVPAKDKTPVLVELFTSEGCSSCPPADALLARLLREQPVAGARIIVLGEHVDYWDGLGWRDRFSSMQSTARQRFYGTRFGLESVYTPQMVVDGAAEFVGNDQRAALKAVREAARGPKLALTLSSPVIEGRKFSAAVSVADAAGLSGPAKGELFAALVDPMDTTEVKRGENGGRTLQHVAVVRTLARIGGTKDLARGPVSFSLTAPEGADVSAMQVVVFAQKDGLGPVLGVAMSDGRGGADTSKLPAHAVASNASTLVE